MGSNTLTYKYSLTGDPANGFAVGIQDSGSGFTMSYNGTTLDTNESVNGSIGLSGTNTYSGLAIQSGFVVKNDNGGTITYWLFSNSSGLTGALGASANSTLDITSLVCFLRGTLILTSRGEVPVERLRVGDLVATKFGGLTSIRWIGTQRIEGRLAGGEHQPVRFRPGSIGHGLPSFDLYVSPGHAMLVAGGSGGDVLAHAGALVNGTTIVRARFQGVLEYFHIDLGPHDCVLANGTWAESYFEDRNRNAFHNAADFHARFPGHDPVRQETCLPIITADHPEIVELNERLVAGAAGVPIAA